MVSFSPVLLSRPEWYGCSRREEKVGELSKVLEVGMAGAQEQEVHSEEEMQATQGP